MKKAFKLLVWIVGGFVALVLLAVLAMPLWFSPLVTVTLNSVVPGITGTDFSVDRLSFNPYTGVLRVHELHLANPQGYKYKEAVGVNTVRVDVAMLSLFSGKIHFEDIDVNGVYASYFDGPDDTNNVMHIVANAKNYFGIKEKTDIELEIEENEKAEKAEQDAAKIKEGKKIASDEGKKEGTKVIIDRVHTESVRIQLYKMPFELPIPPITLTDIGKEQDGVTWSEAWSTVWNSGKAGVSKVGGGLMDAAGATGAAATDAAKKAAEGATDAAKKAADAASDAAKKAAEGAKEAAKKLGGMLGL